MSMRRVLVVDDDPEITALLRVFLERTGRYEVRTVNQSSAAVGAAMAFRPEAVVLDVCMPGMDGTEVAEALEAIPALRETPVLFLTGLATPDEVGESGWTSGARVCLPKPIRMSELIRRLDHATALGWGPAPAQDPRIRSRSSRRRTRPTPENLVACPYPENWSPR